MLRYTKTIDFWVKGLKVVVKCCLDWNFSMMTSIVGVKYSHVEYQVQIFKTYH